MEPSQLIAGMQQEDNRLAMVLHNTSSILGKRLESSKLRDGVDRSIGSDAVTSNENKRSRSSSSC